MDSTALVHALAAGRTIIHVRRAGSDAVVDSLEVGVYPPLER